MNDWPGGLRQPRVLASFKHPHIVSLYAAFVEEGRLCLAMELVEGGTLVLQRERFAAASPRDVAMLLEKIARAVQYAHEKGVLHRDLKPANILMDGGGQPLVADFGLAKLDDQAELGVDLDPMRADGATVPGPGDLTGGQQRGNSSRCPDRRPGCPLTWRPNSSTAHAAGPHPRPTCGHSA